MTLAFEKMSSSMEGEPTVDFHFCLLALVAELTWVVLISVADLCSARERWREGEREREREMVLKRTGVCVGVRRDIITREGGGCDDKSQ